VNSVIQGVLVSIILAGAFLGSLFTGALCDALGRWRAVLLNELVFLAGSALCAFAPSLWVFIAGRVVVGIAAGMASVVVPVFTVETSPVAIRGAVGVLSQLYLTIGILLAYALGTAFTHIPPMGRGLDWRVMVGAPALLALVHLVVALTFFRGESPRWLLMRGRHGDALQMLAQLRGTRLVDEEFAELEKSVAEELAVKTPSLGVQLRMLRDPLLPIVLATGLMFFQQSTGIDAVLYYLNGYFQAAGMSSELANYASIVVGAINVLCTIISVTIIDKLGRKPLLAISLSGMILTLGGMGVVQLLVHATTTRGIVCVVCTVLFVMSFSVGLGACPWPVINELFTSNCALAVSISLAVNWLTNLATTLVFPILIDHVRVGFVMCGFAGISLLALLFILLLLPETKGRTVEDIVRSMRNKK
jgi:sugar porter (SP) family MFS transporter